MIKRGKEWSWMNTKGCKHIKREGESCRLNNNCTYPNCEIETNMKRKKRKTKRTFKVKVIRFFQNEVIVDWLMFLTFVSTIYLLIYLSTKT